LHSWLDWTVRETVRAKHPGLARRILCKHGYPPDKQGKTTMTVLEQAELLSQEWAAA
jgi:type I restriction enzyme R subunit